MAAPIYLDQRGPFERMMPNMMQMLLANQMRTRQLQEDREFGAEQAEAARRYEMGLKGQEFGTKMQEQGRMPLTDQWAQQGVSGGVTSPYTGQTYGPRPQPIPVKIEGIDTPVFYDPVKRSFFQPKTTKPNYSTKDITDEQGNVIRIVTDKATGDIVKKESLGKIGKPGRTGVNLSIGEQVGQRETAKNKAWAEGPNFANEIESKVMSKLPNKQEWAFLSPSTKYQMKKEEATSALSRIYGNKNVTYGFDSEKGWGYSIKKGKEMTFIPWESPVIQFFPEQELSEDGGQVLRGTLPK